jgi:hypothetical protein
VSGGWGRWCGVVPVTWGVRDKELSLSALGRSYQYSFNQEETASLQSKSITKEKV